MCRLILLCLIAGRVAAQPRASDAGSPSPSHLLACCAELRSTVLAPDGTALQGATITIAALDGVSQQHISAADGSFVFQSLPAGTLTLKIAAPGFVPAMQNIPVAVGTSVVLPPILLQMAMIKISVNVVASQRDVSEAQMHLEEQQRLIGVLPNFFVSYNWNAAPLTSGQKFRLAFKNASDPGNLLLVGTVAGVQQASDSFNGYGQGAAGYGRRYGADLGNLVVGTFMGGAVLPSLFHQDPRYFYKGTGSIRSRALYAISSAVICRGDNGRRQPAFASVLGDLSAGAISNLYYAPSDRQGARLTLANGFLGVAGDAMNDLFQEFVLPKLTSRAEASHARKPLHP